jgi:putative PEP-CTERM system TPR-repeat lipoprotein
MAEASIAQRDFVSALDAQRRALALQPDHPQTLVALASTYLVAGQPDDAIAEARRLQRERPKAALGFALEGELLAAQKKYPEAYAAVQQALARQPLPALAIRQVALLNAAGKPGEARAFADRWVREHPKDAGFLMLLGQYREGSNDASGAIAAYRAALELEPDNAVVLNNLAWLLQEQGRPEARELAERAYRLAPINPSVIDTLGWTLVRQGETQRGISLLRMAANLQPNDGRIRIHLAQALAKGGDKAAARRELELVISRDSRAPTKAEAEKLLRSL